MDKTEREARFRQMYVDGMAAGFKAVENIRYIQPMIVEGQSDNGEIKQYVVPDGPCGFAWVNVSPGTSPFARWLKAQGLAHKSYYGGVDIWISDYNQSMAKKEVHARAMAQHFSDCGHRATMGSRMD